MADITGRQSRIGRSVLAILAGMIAVIILSLATDMALVTAGVFPPLDRPAAFTTGMLLAATAYRSIYGIIGGMTAAHLASSRPIAHSLVLGFLGLLASLGGAASMWGAGPNWYPVALVVLALPAAWLGGVLHARLCFAPAATRGGR